MTGTSTDQLAVGDVAEMTCSIDADLIAGFVTLTGDRNPIHRDADFAASTSFGQPIAPGMLAAALVAAVIGSALPGPGAVYVSQTLKFLRPVRLADNVTARVEVAEILRERNRVCLRTQCLNGSGNPVLIGEAWVMPPAKAASSQPRPIAPTVTVAQAA